MRHRRSYIRDDTALAIIVRVGFDAEQIAHARDRAIGAEYELRLQSTAALQLDLYALIVLFERAQLVRAKDFDARVAAHALPQAIHQQTVFDDVPERIATERIGIETQLAAPGCVPDAHAAIRLRACGAHGRPHVQLFEQGGRVGREGIDAQIRRIGAPGRGFMRFDDGHAQTDLGQRQRGCRADHAGADHDRIEPAAPAHAPPRANAGTSPR